MNAATFESVCRPMGRLELPEFSGTRVMMMPVLIGVAESIPPMLAHWRDTITELGNRFGKHEGEVGYITIDEKNVGPGNTHRRGGMHVDGVFRGGVGPWADQGGWGSVGNGMLTVASHVGCRAWNQTFVGKAGYEGEADHLADQIIPGSEVVFGANEVFWVDGLCVHESIEQPVAVDRQFVRLSAPSTAPWFDGYTVNPLGIQPTGPTLARREFMDS